MQPQQYQLHMEISHCQRRQRMLLSIVKVFVNGKCRFAYRTKAVMDGAAYGQICGIIAVDGRADCLGGRV
jgi:hypothetical protein